MSALHQAALENIFQHLGMNLDAGHPSGRRVMHVTGPQGSHREQNDPLLKPVCGHATGQHIRRGDKTPWIMRRVMHP